MPALRRAATRRSEAGPPSPCMNRRILVRSRDSRGARRGKGVRRTRMFFGAVAVAVVAASAAAPSAARTPAALAATPAALDLASVQGTVKVVVRGKVHELVIM